ncbi:hypothetical protein [Candidatus Palauibacter sp.]|uniref:hypothetical protein n=1 Tax=Candidatus Palauibacter sp. TaxID=3101350 RepID=UPI003D0E91BF
MANVEGHDQSRYQIVLVCGDEVLPPQEWPVSGLVPERIRISCNGVTLGYVAAESGDGRLDAGDAGRFQVRYAWIDDDEVTSYAPGEFWRGFRECSGLPDTLALYRRDGDGRYMFLHEEAIGWPPPFRRRRWIEWEDLSLATRVEYMDGEIDTLPLGTPPRRPGMTELGR